MARGRGDKRQRMRRKGVREPTAVPRKVQLGRRSSCPYASTAAGGRKEGSGETRRFVFIKCSTTSSSSALKISQLVVTGRVGAGGKALARFAYHRIVHVTPNSIFNTLPESAMDGRTKTGEEGGAPRRSSEPSPCRSKRHTFWGQVRQLRKTNGASLPSPFDARQFARDRRGGGGKRSGASERERKSALRCQLFTTFVFAHSLLSLLTRSFSPPSQRCRISTST